MMDWKDEIKEKQDLVNKTMKEIKEIKSRNIEAILEPLKEKYLNKIIKIDSETYMYVTEIDDERHIRGISIGSYGSDFFIDYDVLQMVSDKYEFVSGDTLIEFINKQLALTLDKIQ